MNKIIKYGWWLLIIAPLVFAFGVYVKHDNQSIQSNQPICPDDFKDPKQEIASFSKWVEEFAEQYPNATNSDLSKARKNFYIENNCKEALKRYNDYMAGNVDKETQQLIEIVIQQELFDKKAQELANTNKHEDLISLSKEYIKEHPNYWEAWMYLSLAYYHLGNCAEATTAARHVNAIVSPDNDSELGKMVKELLPTILGSDICKDKTKK